MLNIILTNWRLFGAVSWAVSFLLYITLPPSPDQFNHAYMGWRLLEGDILYHDIYDQNWPGVSGLHALAIALFGVNLWSWRTFDFLLFAASGIALSDLARLAVNGNAQRVCLLLLPPIYVSANYWIAGQQDMSAAQLLVGVLWFNVHAYKTKRSSWQLGSGLFLALAVLNKPTVGIIVIFLFLQAVWLGVTLRTALVQTSILAVSAIFITSAIFALILAQGATIQNILDLLWAFTMARREVRATSMWHMAYGMLSGSTHPWWYPSLIASIPAAAWLLRKENRSAPGVSLLALWLTGLVSYFVQGNGVGYHLAPSFIAMAAANAITFYLLASDKVSINSSIWGKQIDVIFVSGVTLMIAVKLAVAYYSLPTALAHHDFRTHWAKFRTGNGDVTVRDTVEFIDNMRQLASKDCIFVIGNDSALNYLSKHRQPTRFYYFDVLANMGQALPLNARWMSDWYQDLSNAKCPLVLISKDIITKWLPLDMPASNTLRAFLKDYVQVGALGTSRGDIIFERKFH